MTIKLKLSILFISLLSVTSCSTQKKDERSSLDTDREINKAFALDSSDSKPCEGDSDFLKCARQNCSEVPYDEKKSVYEMFCDNFEGCKNLILVRILEARTHELEEKLAMAVLDAADPVMCKKIIDHECLKECWELTKPDRERRRISRERFAK